MYSTVNQLDSNKNKIQNITEYMLWCFPLVPLCNTSWPLMWRGLTSHPGPCPSVLLICHFTSHPPYNENQLFAALPHTHHLCFMPLCLCPSYSFQSLSLHSAFPFNLLEPISWHALHQLLHDCTPSLDEESRSPLSAEQTCIEPHGLGPRLCPRPRDLGMNGVQSSAQ